MDYLGKMSNNDKLITNQKLDLAFVFVLFVVKADCNLSVYGNNISGALLLAFFI